MIGSSGPHRKEYNMETLKAQTRDLKNKARKLRREGFITATLSGHELEHSLSLQINANEAAIFAARHHVGSKITLNVDGKDHTVMIKSMDKDYMNSRLLDMTFQQLVAGEKVKGVAEIVLLHEDKAQGYITRDISTIEYKAYPKDIVDTIELDVSEYPVGTELTVADLAFAKKKDVDVTSPATSSVLHVAAHAKMDAASEALLEADEEAAAAKVSA